MCLSNESDLVCLRRIITVFLKAIPLMITKVRLSQIICFPFWKNSTKEHDSNNRNVIYFLQVALNCTKIPKENEHSETKQKNTYPKIDPIMFLLTADKSLLLIASSNLCDTSLILVLSSLFGFINEDERATVRRPACADEEKGKKIIIITNPSKISDKKHHHQQQTFSVPANHDLMNIHNASLGRT